MVILGLGSNMGDRHANLDRAVDALTPLLSGLRRSTILESQALLPPGAPHEWNIPFLNMAVSGETQLSAQALLKEIKAIEGQLGRKTRGRWGPREIDIDILAWDEAVVNTPELTIPHAGLVSRDFALLPLAELAPDWVHPVTGKAAHELAHALRSGS